MSASIDWLSVPAGAYALYDGGMTTTRTPNVKRMLAQAAQLEPKERAYLIRELIGYEGLYGASEAAERLNVKQPNLRPIPGLPDAVAQLRCGSVWLREEVDELARTRKARAPAAA
jgi:hypothetical protein